MLSALKSENKENGSATTSFQGETSTPQSFNQWESANLGDDGANEKFRRLMGLGKSTSKPPSSGKGLFGSLKKSPALSKHGSSVADRDQVSKMFSQQEQQFQQAVGAKRG